MSDIAGQESTSEEIQTAAGGEDVSIQTQDHSTGEQPQANPFWGEVEKLTGPNVYKLIQPHLAKADTEARSRVESVNQSYAPWKRFADQEISPDQVEQALGVVRQLNDPNGQVQIFQSLQNFLRENGRLPSETELSDQVEEDESDAQQQEDPRIAELAQQQQALMQFLANQHQEQLRQKMDQEANSWLDAESTRLQSKGYDADDIKEIFRIASASLGADGKVPDSLDAAAAHYDALRDRIRTTPRPGQLAPRLPSGPGGGTPQGGAIDPSTLSKDQRRQLVADMLQRGKQS